MLRRCMVCNMSAICGTENPCQYSKAAWRRGSFNKVVSVVMVMDASP